MKAMILAAGLGTRLHPMTNNTPKALIKINDKTLLGIAIEKLIYYDFNEIVINVHHLADQIVEFVEQSNFDAKISISQERDELLDTGGGLKNAERFLTGNEPFLLHNVDIVSNLNLRSLFEFHLNSDAIVTLVVRKRKSNRYFLFNGDNILRGWKNERTEREILINDEKPLTKFAFSGIHIIDPKIFTLMPNDKVFSMIEFYLNIMNSNIINTYIDNESFWMDVGNPESLKIAEENFDKFLL